MRSRWRTAFLAGMLGSLLIPAARAQDEKKKEKQEPEKERRTAYVRRLFEKNRATFGDACRSVQSLASDEHTDADFEAIHKQLVEKGTVVKGWDLKESSPVTRGVLAYMLCKTLKIKGGLTVRVFGWSRRYAFRECLYVGLIPRGTTGQYVTGRQLIDILGNAEVYKEKGNLDSQRK